MKNNYSDFGKKVKTKLIEIDKTQEWLIAEVKKDTGLFVDSSYLNRILTGRNNNTKIITSIKKILMLGGETDLSTDTKIIAAKLRECLDYLENGAEIEPVKPATLKAPPTPQNGPLTDSNGKLLFALKGYEVDFGQTVTLSDSAVGIINAVWMKTGLCSTEIIDRMLQYAYENSEFYIGEEHH